jgi:UDP-N-acetyl-D-glucosamine dehydrogenase
MVGRSYFKHIRHERIVTMNPGNGFEATTDFAKIANVDAILICVPTPLTKARDPDMSYIVGTAETIVPHLKKGQLIVLESTTYPGTTRDILRPILENSGLKAGSDFYLAFSPERVVPVSSCEVAEACKLTENIYRAVNIALVNELKVIYSAMGIDVWEVLDAAATKPFGFGKKENKTFFTPGPGLGGHCIPIDPFYLAWKAREHQIATRFIELAGEINTSMPDYVIRQLTIALNERRQSVRGAKILVLGLAYKPDIDDLRESPAITIIEKLQHLGADVSYNDPYIPHTRPQREHDLRMQSVELTPQTLADQDAVLIVTNHSCYDYAWIVANARLVVDTRNACRGVTEGREKIVKA